MNLSVTTLVLHPDFVDLADFMRSLPERWAAGEGEVIHKGRNELRVLSYGGRRLVVKAFRRPHFINCLVYGVWRPSKAKRSYDNARLLLSLGVGTPVPVGYYNVRAAGGLLFNLSYYVSLESPCTHRYEELFERRFDYEDDVTRAVGRLTALLHNNRLAHKDYGRANILFERQADGSVRLELVDLNRMAHGALDVKAGCKNLERLPATPRMHRCIAGAYAEARGFDAEECFRLMEYFRSTQPGKVEGKY